MKNLIALVLLLLLAVAAPAHALRCNGKLVDSGDHAVRVRERCGEPFWIDSYSEWLIVNADGPVEQRVEYTVDVWFYNFGDDRLMHRLVFRDDRLEREETLGYGFDRKAQQCNVDTLSNGLSSGEIIARCGVPDSRRERYRDQVERDDQGNSRIRVQRREDWVYAGESRREQRLLVMVDGRLQETQRLDRAP